MRNWYFAVILSAIIIFTQKTYAVQYTLDTSVRSYVVGGAIEASALWDQMVWDEREGGSFWHYGYVAGKATLGTQGLYQLTFNLAPISIVELSYSASGTARFYDSKVFDCTIYNCKGNVSRNKVGIKVALGVGDYYFLPVYQKIHATFGNNSLLAIDETDNLLFTGSGDDLTVSALILGKKIENMKISLVYRAANYEISNMKNENSLVIASWDILSEKCDGEACAKKSFGFGLGTYSSSVSPTGITAAAFYKLGWGEALGLF